MVKKTHHTCLPVRRFALAGGPAKAGITQMATPARRKFWQAGIKNRKEKPVQI